MPDPLAILSPSPIRRVMAVTVLFATGALMLWVAVTKPPASVGWTLFLVAIGTLMIWLTWRLWLATARAVMLTREGIFDSDGFCLCRVEDVASVEAGVFAFKPSNGFTVRLKRGSGFSWAPGLWWRIGRRLGVGGVTPKSEGKYMAEVLTLIVSEGQGETAP